jgi:rubrerythrin
MNDFLFHSNSVFSVCCERCNSFFYGQPHQKVCPSCKAEYKGVW